jgi:hypothetical protein
VQLELAAQVFKRVLAHIFMSACAPLTTSTFA